MAQYEKQHDEVGGHGYQLAAIMSKRIHYFRREWWVCHENPPPAVELAFAEPLVKLAMTPLVAQAIWEDPAE